MWSVFALITVVWLTIWISVALHFSRQKSLPALVGLFSNLLPAFAGITCTLIFLLLPFPASPPSVLVRAIHYLGIVLLFLFLSFGAYCLGELWIHMRHKDEPLGLLRATYRKFWVATRLLPAPAALCILLSGLRLAYESFATVNLSIPWFFWLVTAFCFFFYDGLLFYLPEVCLQFKNVSEADRQGKTVGQFSDAHRSRRNEGMLLFHSISFVFVIALPIAKPTTIWIPGQLIAWLHHLFVGLPPAEGRAAETALLILLIGMLMFVLRCAGLIRYIRLLK